MTSDVVVKSPYTGNFFNLKWELNCGVLSLICGIVRLEDM